MPKCTVFYPHKDSFGNLSKFESDISIEDIENNVPISIDYLFNAMKLSVIYEWSKQSDKVNSNNETLSKYKNLISKIDNVHLEILKSIFDESIPNDYRLRITKSLCEHYFEVISNDR